MVNFRMGVHSESRIGDGRVPRSRFPTSFRPNFAAVGFHTSFKPAGSLGGRSKVGIETQSRTGRAAEGIAHSSDRIDRMMLSANERDMVPDFKAQFYKMGSDKEQAAWVIANRKTCCDTCRNKGSTCVLSPSHVRCHPCALRKVACSRVKQYRRQRMMVALNIGDDSYDRLVQFILREDPAAISERTRKGRRNIRSTIRGKVALGKGKGTTYSKPANVVSGRIDAGPLKRKDESKQKPGPGRSSPGLGIFGMITATQGPAHPIIVQKKPTPACRPHTSQNPALVCVVPLPEPQDSLMDALRRDNKKLQTENTRLGVELEAKKTMVVEASTRCRNMQEAVIQGHEKNRQLDEEKATVAELRAKISAMEEAERATQVAHYIRLSLLTQIVQEVRQGTRMDRMDQAIVDKRLKEVIQGLEGCNEEALDQMRKEGGNPVSLVQQFVGSTTLGRRGRGDDARNREDGEDYSALKRLRNEDGSYTPLAKGKQKKE